MPCRNSAVSGIVRIDQLQLKKNIKYPSQKTFNLPDENDMQELRMLSPFPRSENCGGIDLYAVTFVENQLSQ